MRSIKEMNRLAKIPFNKYLIKRYLELEEDILAVERVMQVFDTHKVRYEQETFPQIRAMLIDEAYELREKYPLLKKIIDSWEEE